MDRVPFFPHTNFAALLAAHTPVEANRQSIVPRVSLFSPMWKYLSEVYYCNTLAPKMNRMWAPARLYNLAAPEPRKRSES